MKTHTTIRDYFTHDIYADGKGQLDPTLKELADLARGCVREGMLTLAVMPHDCNIMHGCVVCGSTDSLMPMRAQLGHRNVVAIFCAKCQKRVPVLKDQYFRGRLKRLVIPTDPNQSLLIEMAYLFRRGPRTQIVWGRDINTEALS